MGLKQIFLFIFILCFQLQNAHVRAGLAPALAVTTVRLGKVAEKARKTSRMKQMYKQIAQKSLGARHKFSFAIDHFKKGKREAELAEAAKDKIMAAFKKRKHHKKTLAAIAEERKRLLELAENAKKHARRKKRATFDKADGEQTEFLKEAWGRNKKKRFEIC